MYTIKYSSFFPSIKKWTNIQPEKLTDVIHSTLYHRDQFFVYLQSPLSTVK